jgi:hypothetical protein
VVAARGIDDGTSEAARSAVAGRAAARVLADLNVATGFTERTAKAVTFTVPDRNGDNQPETIRYAWSGTAGAPLTREYNNGPAAAVADDVKSLDFTYLLRTLDPPTGSGSSTVTESAVKTFAAHAVAGSAQAFALKNTSWPAEYFKPPMPANAVSWKVTRVRVQLQRASSSASGVINIQIRAVDAAKKPTATVLGSQAVDIATVPTLKTWVDVTFASPVAGLDPAKGVAIVIHTAASAPGSAYYDKASTDAAIAYSSTTNTGGSWSAPTTGDALMFYAYGTVTTQD